MAEKGPYSTEVGDMFAVHHAILGALDAAPDLVTKAGADPERVATISSFYDNVLEFLHGHHSGEDELIYPLLEQRCPDLDDVLERIDAQHTLLYEPMDRAWELISAWAAAPSQDGAVSVVDAINKINETLRPHLAEEEQTVVPLASQWLSPEEWGQLPGHALGTFRKDKPWLAMGLVQEQLTPEQRAGMLGGMPPELQSLWSNDWEPQFQSFIADVRR